MIQTNLYRRNPISKYCQSQTKKKNIYILNCIYTYLKTEKCNRNALNKCGRVFIHSFAFIQPKKASNGDSYLNIKGNDILTTECALRQVCLNLLIFLVEYKLINNILTGIFQLFKIENQLLWKE